MGAADRAEFCFRAVVSKAFPIPSVNLFFIFSSKSERDFPDSWRDVVVHKGVTPWADVVGGIRSFVSMNSEILGA